MRMAEYDNIELRSEKVQEIIGKAPGGIVRNGIGMLTTVLVCLALVACFIPYPENVTVSVFVTQVDERYVEVTALVPYRFITKVHKGMSADIEFEGYASSEYGLLKAEIEGLEDSIVTVSGDNFFSTKLIIEKKDIELYHLQVKMKGTASILLSKRSLIDMFS